MHTHTFDLDSGALCLDFANTMEWHASDHPQDKLHDYKDLIAWAEAAAVLSPDQANLARQMAQEKPPAAGAALKRAIQLREAIYRLFVDVSENRMAGDEDLAFLNKSLQESLSHLQVVPTPSGFAWDWAETPLDFDQILWSIARSAGELLTSAKLGRVRQCADDRGCGYLFIDTSRNRSRRWCSMESCGNRAKAQRHYRKIKKTGA
jgi:predicted RNA-binding Zn ribbon-like protein